MGIEEDIKRFNDFAGQVDFIPLSFEEMLGLSKQEFSEYYFRLMSTLRHTEGWWIERKVPYCHDCGREILSPEKLRMYRDRPYDQDCFKRTYQEDIKKYSELMQKYWRKVLEID